MDGGFTFQIRDIALKKSSGKIEIFGVTIGFSLSGSKVQSMIVKFSTSFDFCLVDVAVKDLKYVSSQILSAEFEKYMRN